MKQNPSTNRTQIIVVSALLGLGILVLLVLVAFALLRDLPPSVAAPTASVTPPIPTILVPTVDCGTPTLVLGTSTFQIQNLTPAANDSFVVPSDTSGIAYWVEGTNSNAVFVLPPTPANLTVMSAVSVGTTAKVTLSNCNSTTYSLVAGQASALDIPALSDQSSEGITIFFETDTSGAGFVYKGEITEQQISTFNTPNPLEIQAEIGILETTTSADGTTIRISVSVHNYGTLPITLSVNDVSLLQTDSTPLVMVNSEPPLPKQIAAGATDTISFTFPKPATPTATLKILTIEFDVEGY